MTFRRRRTVPRVPLAEAAENGTPECCGHRDVLPLTGANGFDAGRLVPDCGYYKLRRTPKKRDDYGDVLRAAA